MSQKYVVRGRGLATEGSRQAQKGRTRRWRRSSAGGHCVRIAGAGGPNPLRSTKLDADIIAWFEARAPGGRGYQTDINGALREHVRRTARSLR